MLCTFVRLAFRSLNGVLDIVQRAHAARRMCIRFPGACTASVDDGCRGASSLAGRRGQNASGGRATRKAQHSWGGFGCPAARGGYAHHEMAQQTPLGSGWSSSSCGPSLCSLGWGGGGMRFRSAGYVLRMAGR